MTHSLARGGSPIFLIEFARAFRVQAGELLLITEQDGPLRPDFEALGVRVIIEPRGGILEAGLLWRLHRTLRRERVALVHLNTFSSYYKYGAIAARLAKLPVVWGIREDVRAKRCRRLYPWIKRLATCIMPCSREIAERLYPEGAPAKVEVVHDGLPLRAAPVSAPNLREWLKIPAGAKIIGCVAALEPRKGIKELIQAFALLRQRGVDAHLVCAGEDRSAGHTYLPMLKELIAELDLGERIHLTGGRADVAGFYPQFDVFTLPTYWEGISRVLLEAAFANCPIVTTRAGGNGEFVADGQGGLLAPPGDVPALAAALERMLGDRSFAQRCAAHSRVVLERGFTLDAHVEKVRAIYERLLASR
ncbi:MAG TPA: glycosyltransferase [Verrucomicrobiae bacterium]|nr:glycosyltransferase [Verrucomicrobiae bacterium]